MQNSFKSEACEKGNPKWEQAIKRETEIYSRNDIRTDFERDYTRILHSQAYRRLKHKTQVFFAPHNDHICTRMEHVMHVASVASTITKYLGLNEQLATAIGMGHDIGHAPFGHHGEDCLNKLLEQKDENAENMSIITKKPTNGAGPKKFWHERNSLFFADYIETLPDPNEIEQPLNLTYAIRDGLICHCGEIDQQGIKPRDENIDLYSIKRPGFIQPFTWEGCIVKIADKIAYLGRDIEDARAYHILDMTSYRQLREIVGSTLGFERKGAHALRSGKAINTTVLINDLIVDLCEQSSPEKGICFSEEYFKFIKEMKKFNFAYIYNHWRLKEFSIYAENIISTIYRTLQKTHDYAKNGRVAQALKYYPKLCSTFEDWLIKHTAYRPYIIEKHDFVNKKNLLRYNTPVVFDVMDNESYTKCIIEFISGMTDQFAIQVYEEIITF